MAREKTMISRAVFCSEEFAELSTDAQAAFTQLNLEADGGGVVTGASRVVRGFGFDPGCLAELENNGFIFKMPEHDSLIVIRDWWVMNNLHGNKSTLGAHRGLIEKFLCMINYDRSYFFKSDLKDLGEYQQAAPLALEIDHYVTSECMVSNLLLTGAEQVSPNISKDKVSKKNISEESKSKVNQQPTETSGNKRFFGKCSRCGASSEHIQTENGFLVRCPNCGEYVETKTL